MVVAVRWRGDHTLVVRISDRERVLGVGSPTGPYLIGASGIPIRGVLEVEPWSQGASPGHMQGSRAARHPRLRGRGYSMGTRGERRLQEGGATRSAARSRASPAAGCSGRVGSAQVHGWRQPVERLARTDCLWGDGTARVPPAFGCFPHSAPHCMPEVSRRRISLLGTTLGHFCISLAPCRLIALGVILIIALPRVEGVAAPIV